MLIEISPFLILDRVVLVIQPISTLKAISQEPAPFLARPIIIRPSASRVWAMCRPPTSSGRSPRLSRKVETRAFASNGADRPPKWADFADPLDAIGARFHAMKPQERKALEQLGLAETADKSEIKTRFKELVKLHHPDSNGGDRSMEHRLAIVIRAFKALKASGLA